MPDRKAPRKTPPEAPAVLHWSLSERQRIAQLNRVLPKQQAELREIAEKLENGDALNAAERRFAAAVLRTHADRMVKPAKRSRGQPSPFSLSEIAIRMAVAIHRRGLSEFAARSDAANRYGCDEKTAGRAFKLFGQSALAWLRQVDAADTNRPE